MDFVKGLSAIVHLVSFLSLDIKLCIETWSNCLRHYWKKVIVSAPTEGLYCEIRYLVSLVLFLELELNLSPTRIKDTLPSLCQRLTVKSSLACLLIRKHTELQYLITCLSDVEG